MSALNTSGTDGNSLRESMDARRHLACLRAAWEIDVIARALPGLVPSDSGCEETYAGQLLLRALAGRLLRLTHVLTSALADDAVATESLEHILDLQEGQG